METTNVGIDLELAATSSMLHFMSKSSSKWTPSHGTRVVSYGRLSPRPFCSWTFYLGGPQLINELVRYDEDIS